MNFSERLWRIAEICLSIKEVEIEGKTVLYIFVPESSQVHRCNGKIFDRNEDGDFDITDNTNLVTALYMRKQGSYTENRIFPYAQVSNFKADLLTRVRKMAANERVDHPWKSMNDLELLKSADYVLKIHKAAKKVLLLLEFLSLGAKF